MSYERFLDAYQYCIEDQALDGLGVHVAVYRTPKARRVAEPLTPEGPPHLQRVVPWNSAVPHPAELVAMHRAAIAQGATDHRLTGAENQAGVENQAGSSVADDSAAGSPELTRLAHSLEGLPGDSPHDQLSALLRPAPQMDTALVLSTRTVADGFVAETDLVTEVEPPQAVTPLTRVVARFGREALSIVRRNKHAGAKEVGAAGDKGSEAEAAAGGFVGQAPRMFHIVLSEGRAVLDGAGGVTGWNGTDQTLISLQEMPGGHLAAAPALGVEHVVAVDEKFVTSFVATLGVPAPGPPVAAVKGGQAGAAAAEALLSTPPRGGRRATVMDGPAESLRMSVAARSASIRGRSASMRGRSASALGRSASMKRKSHDVAATTTTHAAGAAAQRHVASEPLICADPEAARRLRILRQLVVSSGAGRGGTAATVSGETDPLDPLMGDGTVGGFTPRPPFKSQLRLHVLGTVEAVDGLMADSVFSRLSFVLPPVGVVPDHVSNRRADVAPPVEFLSQVTLASRFVHTKPPFTHVVRHHVNMPFEAHWLVDQDGVGPMAPRLVIEFWEWHDDGVQSLRGYGQVTFPPRPSCSRVERVGLWRPAAEGGREAIREHFVGGAPSLANAATAAINYAGRLAARLGGGMSGAAGAAMNCRTGIVAESVGHVDVRWAACAQMA